MNQSLTASKLHYLEEELAKKTKEVDETRESLNNSFLLSQRSTVADTGAFSRNAPSPAELMKASSLLNQ